MKEWLSSTTDRAEAAVRWEVEQKKLEMLLTYRKELSDIQDEMLILVCSGKQATQS